MAASKRKKNSKRRAKTQPVVEDISSALGAVSTPETAEDAKSDKIYHCVVVAFDQEGLRHISSPADRIVWSTIPDDVILNLGDDMTECIRGTGWRCPPLAPAFQLLKNNNLVTAVSDLVDTIARAATP